MLFPLSKRAEELRQRVTAFMEEHIYPAEHVFERQLNELPSRWEVPPIMEELKAKAKAQGLWNLFLPKHHDPDALTNVEYAQLCEIMGRSPIGPEPFNCSAPDTGNMETIIRYGTDEHKKRWLKPLLDGEIRSCLRDDRAGGRFVGRHQHPLADHARRRPLRHQRPQVVDLRRDGPALQDRDLHGPDRSRRAGAQAAIDGAGADGHAGRQGDPVAHGIRLRRCAARPCRGVVRERARAGVEHPARRGPRLRDRAGPSRTGPHPPLHALDRRRRACARIDVPARDVALDVRSSLSPTTASRGT